MRFGSGNYHITLGDDKITALISNVKNFVSHVPSPFSGRNCPCGAKKGEGTPHIETPLPLSVMRSGGKHPHRQIPKTAVDSYVLRNGRDRTRTNEPSGDCSTP